MANDQSGGQAQGPQIPEINLPQFNSRKIGIGVLVLLGVIGLLTSFYTVGPEEVGLVLRFGGYKGSTEPGLHFKAPFGVDQVLKVAIERQHKEEFGFRTLRAGVNSQFSSKPYRDESNMLTGDLNAALVEWVVQFRIVDPYLYLFRVRNVDETFRDMNEAVMRRIIGDRTINEVITVGRAEVAMEAQVALQELCKKYETGIKIEQIVLKNVNPPDPVKPSFNAVNEAQQEKETLINHAQSEYNRAIPSARGEALQTIKEAEGYALDRVNRAQGDAALFTSMYDAYRRSPDVTRQRIYLETMGTVLPLVKNKIIVDDNLKGVLPLLNLNNLTTAGGK